MITRRKVRQKNDIHLGFGAKSAANSFYYTASTSYVVARRFEFRGTRNVGKPKRFSAIVEMSAAGQGDVRLYDLTNANLIGRILDFTETAWTIKRDKTLENLPITKAIFEVQIRTDNVLQDARITAASLQF